MTKKKIILDNTNKNMNDVFTPKWLIQKMLKDVDKLFKANPNLTFKKATVLEPTCGTGNFLIELLKWKLHLIKKYQNHDWAKNALRAISTLYGIDINKSYVQTAHNRLYRLIKSCASLHVHNQKLLKSFYTKAQSVLKKHIYTGNFLRSKLTFQPDLIIGNPPYMIRNHTHHNKSYSQLFHKFVYKAMALKPKYLTMIIPNRWFSGGKNLKRFRADMLYSEQLKAFRIWNDSRYIFPNARILGGVNYFIWVKGYHNHNHINVEHFKKQKMVDEQNQPLAMPNSTVFMNNPVGVRLLKALKPYLAKDDFSHHMSSSNPFGLRTFIPKRSKHWHTKPIRNGVKCYANYGQIGYYPKKMMLKNLKKRKTRYKYIPLINQWKLITPMTNMIGMSAHPKPLNVTMIAPNSICTETYGILGYNLHLNKQKLEHLKKYLQTDFVKYLLSLHKSSQHAVRYVYSFVPVLDYSSRSKIDWSKSVANINQQLMDFFKLSKTEKQAILNY